jgi:MFS family permease
LETQNTTPVQHRNIRQRGWFIITGLAIGHSVFHWLLQSFAVVLPEVQRAFGLNAVGVGAVITVREVASAAVALPGGIVVDALRRHWGLVLAGCILGFSGGALLIGLSPFFPLLLVGMAVVAISHSLWHLPASASLSYHFPRSRAMALSFHGVGGSVGDVVGPVATGGLLMVLSWRGIISIYGAVPLFLAYLALWAFKNIGRKTESDVQEKATVNRVEVTRQLLRDKVLWAITFIKGMRSMSLAALVTVLPLYLDNELEMEPFARGFHIGLLIMVGLVAKPIAGYLSDRVGRKQVLVPGLIWSGVISLVLIFNGEGLILTVLIVLLGMFLYPDQPILTAAVLDRVDQSVASTALGLSSFVGFLMSATSPLIAGGLYEYIGVDATLYYVAGLFFFGAAILAVLPLRSPDALDVS